MSLRVKVPSAGDSTKRIAEGKGVHREVESEGSSRQTVGPTNRTASGIWEWVRLQHKLKPQAIRNSRC